MPDVTAPASTPPDPADFEHLDGALVRWDGCGPISWVLRRGPGPADALQVATEAVEEMADATGLTFRFAGETDELVTSNGAGDRTIAIGWATPDELPELDGSVAGIGGFSVTWSAASQPVPRSGHAVVDASEGLSPGFADGASEGAVLLHELGHALGLAHVDDPLRLMAPMTNPDLSGHLQPGDRAALAFAVDPRPCP